MSQNFHWGERLANNEWHTIRVKRRAQRVWLFLDGIWDYIPKIIDSSDYTLSYEKILAGHIDVDKDAHTDFKLHEIKTIGFVGEITAFVFNELNVFQFASQCKLLQFHIQLSHYSNAITKQR
jgi:hypothetical protein